MFSKTIFAFAFIAASQLVAAIPPACLLGALNTYDTPGDISSVCKQKDASTTIAKFCGDSTQEALSSFADTCNKAGVEVSTEINTTATASSASSKATGTGASSHASATGSVSAATTLATTTATGTAANIASPSQTGGAGNGESPSASGTSTGAPAQSTGAAGRMEIAGAALFAGVVAAFL